MFKSPYFEYRFGVENSIAQILTELVVCNLTSGTNPPHN
jgi:hypothetical protein